MIERALILARYLRSQIALADRPPVGRVELNNEEAGVCAEALEKLAAESMPASLEDKLATMLWYLDQQRFGRMSSDTKAFDSYLDDAEVTNWLDRMQKSNRIVNTRFTNKGR